MLLLTIPFQDRFDLDSGAIVGYATMVLAFLLIYFGVRTYRDTQAGGTISFGKALQVGLLIMLVATVCYVATWEVIYFKLAPGFGERYSELVLAEARKDGASDEEIAERTREMEAFKVQYDKPLVNIAYTFLEPLPVGVLFSLLSAGLLSRRRRDEHAPA
jgi:hypothetical protein